MSERQKTAKAQTPKARVLSSADLSVNMDGVSGKAVHQDFAIWVRCLRQNGRQGTVGCKGRSDVARTNKKPWKQKGTGRARAGSARSPLWRGGGVIFGPQERTKTLSISARQRRGVLKSLLSEYLTQGNIVVLPWGEHKKPATGDAAKALKVSNMEHARVTLFVRPDDEIAFRSFRNIAGVNVIAFDQPNAYHLAGCERWAILDKDLDTFKDMVAKWS